MRRRPSATGQLPVQARAREIAQAGEGEYLGDLTADGVHVRVLTSALPGGRGALQVARPLDEVDRQLDQIVLVLVFVGSAGIALGAGLGALVARTALAPVARSQENRGVPRNRPSPAHGGARPRRARTARGQLQHDSRRT